MAHRLMISAGLAIAVIGVVAVIATGPFGFRDGAKAAQSSLSSDDFRTTQSQDAVVALTGSEQSQASGLEQTPIYVYPDGTLASGADVLNPGVTRQSRGDDDDYDDEGDDQWELDDHEDYDDDREDESADHGEYERDDD